MGADVTTLLAAWKQGDAGAFERLAAVVYRELHRQARRYMAGQSPGRTLQTTALVNEAFLKLVECDRVNWQDRIHFFAVSANLMRRVLVDYARSRNYQKRGAGVRPVAFNEELDAAPERGMDLVALDDAMNELAKIDPRKCQVVEMKFFAGLTTGEIGEVLGVSEPTVLRDWKLAKAWLERELRRA
jgi:RNA polymerase sigma factor (TIGR02999 family)